MESDDYRVPNVHTITYKFYYKKHTLNRCQRKKNKHYNLTVNSICNTIMRPVVKISLQYIFHLNDFFVNLCNIDTTIRTAIIP